MKFFWMELRLEVIVTFKTKENKTSLSDKFKNMVNVQKVDSTFHTYNDVSN